MQQAIAIQESSPRGKGVGKNKMYTLNVPNFMQLSNELNKL